LDSADKEGKKAGGSDEGDDDLSPTSNDIE
jgi:hypothetical protein